MRFLHKYKYFSYTFSQKNLYPCFQNHNLEFRERNLWKLLPSIDKNSQKIYYNTHTVQHYCVSVPYKTYNLFKSINSNFKFTYVYDLWWQMNQAIAVQTNWLWNYDRQRFWQVLVAALEIFTTVTYEFWKKCSHNLNFIFENYSKLILSL